MYQEDKRIDDKQTTNKSKPGKCEEGKCNYRLNIRKPLPHEKGFPYKPLIYEYYCEVHGTTHRFC